MSRKRFLGRSVWLVGAIILLLPVGLAVYRVGVVHALVLQIEACGSAINDDYIPGLGPTVVTIGLHAPGQSPTLTQDEACGILSKLSRFWRLKVVNMNDVTTPPSCIVRMIRETHLVELRANSTSFDDECVSAVIERKSLVLLSIADTRVTYEALERLCALKSLKYLYISRHELTDVELADLRSKLQGVAVEAD